MRRTVGIDEVDTDLRDPDGGKVRVRWGEVDDMAEILTRHRDDRLRSHVLLLALFLSGVFLLLLGVSSASAATTGQTLIIVPASSITLDLGDDGTDESTSLSEIATTGDTNSAFTSPSADKLLIDLSQPWPMRLGDLIDVSEAGAGVGSALVSSTGPTWAPVDIATQAELNAWDTTADDLSDNQIGDLSDVSETGAATGEALVSDGAGAWGPSTSTVCLSDGTNCPVDDAGTDNQTATEVPYAPTTGLDWTDPDPTEVGGALDTLAARDATSDDLSDNSVTDLLDVTAVSGNTTTVATTSGALTDGNVAAFDAAGNIVDSGGAGGATTEAELEADLTDVADVYTDLDTHADLTSTGIDADGDGTEELTVSAGQMNLNPNQTQNPAVRVTGGQAGGNDLLILDSSFGFASVDAGSGLGLLMLRTIDSAGTISLRVGAGGQRFNCGPSGCEFKATAIFGPSTATCTDTGDGSAGFLVITPSTSTVRVTQGDPHGCSSTPSETGARDGQQLRVINVSNAGGTLDFADSAGVQETGAGCSLGDWGVADFEYLSDRWVLTSCRTSN